MSCCSDWGCNQRTTELEEELEELTEKLEKVKSELAYYKAQATKETTLNGLVEIEKWKPEKWKPSSFEDFTEFCTRNRYHSGPCNGFPRAECV